MYQSLVSVSQNYTLISHSPSSKKVFNLNINLFFLTSSFLILLFSLVVSCNLCFLIHLYNLLLTLLIAHLSMCHRSAQLHFLLKFPFHCHHLIFLSHDLHLLQFSRCDFCFVCTFFDSQSSEYNFLVHQLFPSTVGGSHFPSLNLLTASPDLNSFISFVH